MKCLFRALALAGAVATTGCSGKVTPNTAPITDAEKAAIKAQDQSVDAEEKAGSGTATKGRKGK